MFHVYTRPRNCDTEASDSNYKNLGTAKPSGAIPMGITVKVSTSIQMVKIGLVKSVDCEHGNRMDPFVPVPAIRPIAQVGRTLYIYMPQKEA
jgi:hypothetical protein